MDTAERMPMSPELVAGSDDATRMRKKMMIV
jgi:hypothetical protein